MLEKRFSRREFLKLAGLTAGGTILASCQGAPQAAPTSMPEPTQKIVEPTNTPEPTKPPELPEVELAYYFLAWGPMQDVNLVADEMSKMSLGQIKAKIKLVPMDWSQFNEKLQLALAAGEAIDMMFTCNWANDFYANIRNGMLVPLDDLIPKYAPQYWASMKPAIWEAAKVKGVLYGAINQQIWANINGFDIRKDIVDKLKYDVSKLVSLDDYTEFFQAIKDNIPDVYPSGWFNYNESPTWWPAMWKQDSIGGHAAIYWDDKDTKVFADVESPEYQKAIKYAYDWYNKGFLPAEPTQGEEFVANMKAGMYACVPINWSKPGRDSEDKAKYGFDFLNVGITAYSDPFVSTGTVVPTMNAIAKTCKNPERAAMLMEMLNSNVEFYNLICKGIEGKHWVWTDKGMKVIGFPEGMTPETSPYNPNTDWMFGNQFNAYYVDMTQAQNKTWDKTKELNEKSGTSALMGYVFVQDAVTTEMAQMTTVDSEVGTPLFQGRLDIDKNYSSLVQRLKDAGMEKVIEEIKKQITEWKAT